jgi:hypothetical protein
MMTVLVLANETSNEEEPPKMRLVLETTDYTPPNESSQPAETSQLDTKTLQDYLKRLPNLEGQAQVEDFKLPKKTRPTPRAGETVPLDFSDQQEQRPEVDTEAPLEVLRIGPQGEVDFAPYIAVTFSQPMVTIGDQRSASKVLPVRVQPTLKFKPRWAGTQTLILEHSDGLPMATSYEVTVPKGTRSILGNMLEQEVRVNFTTPEVRITNIYPQAKQRLNENSLFTLFFNQAVDPQAISDYLTMLRDEQPVDFEVVDPASVVDYGLKAAMGQAQNHFIILKPLAPISGNTAISVVVKPGMPSLAGPNRGALEERFEFGLNQGFRFNDNYRRGERNYTPSNVWALSFNDRLDPDTFDPNWIRIEPPLENPKFDVNWSSIRISGTKKRGSYRVTLSPDITSKSGQRLENPTTVTFNVVGEEPGLMQVNHQDMIVLDPDTHTYPVLTRNINSLLVELRQVTPRDWHAWQRWQRQDQRKRDPKTLPGNVVHSQTLSLNHPEDTFAIDLFDLEPALTQGLGQVIVSARILDGATKSNRVNHIAQWIQKTNLTLDVIADRETFYGTVRNLNDGKPVAGVAVTLSDLGGNALRQGQTDNKGEVTWQLDEHQSTKMFVASHEGDLAILPEQSYDNRTSWKKQDPWTQAIWYVEDVRGTYRPGETIYVKGWLRHATQGKDIVWQDLQVGETVQLEIQDRSRQIVNRQTLKLGPHGDFDTSFQIPEDFPSGHCTLMFTRPSSRDRHHLMVQVKEFRTPDCEVSVSLDEGPHFLDDPVNAWAQASYFTGAPLTQAPTRWDVSLSETYYRPPNQSSFSFGEPLWCFAINPRSEAISATLESFTDNTGTSNLRVSLAEEPPRRSHQLSMSANVKDPAFQEYAGSNRVLVHPSEYYVGLRTPNYFVPLGEALPVEAIVCDLAGKPISGTQISLEASLETWEQQKDQWKRVLKHAQSLSANSSDKPVSMQFKPAQAGTWVIKARIQDDQGRWNETEITRWVSGGSRIANRPQQQDVSFILAKETYEPGETADLLLLAPFSNGYGTLTVRGNTVLEKIPFQMKGDSHRFKLPITAEHVPNIQLQVSLYGEANNQPTRGEGSLNVKVAPVDKQLELTILPASEELMPGEETNIQVRVSGADGSPVGDADVCVFVVDEAVLAVANKTFRDPMQVFYPQRNAQTSEANLFQRLILGPWNAEDFAAAGAGRHYNFSLEFADVQTTSMRAMPSTPMAELSAKGGADDSQEVMMRENFSPIAAWFPKTDGGGIINVSFTMPDNLTRYRIVAIAASGKDRFGMGEGQLTARLPLMVRPSAPRFLNYGDRFQMPVVIQNQSDQSMEVDLVARIDNGILPDGQSRRVTVPGKDQVQILLPMETVNPGELKFQVAVFGNGMSDAATLSVPVYTPATTEAFATYGSLDDGDQLQGLQLPSDAISAFGGLEITTSSTALHALADAMGYLRDYPYASNEARASRILALTALGDLAEAFDGTMDANKIDQIIKEDIKKLQQQESGGGYAYWKGMTPSPYLSVHVTHAMLRAREAGWQVADHSLKRNLQYLANIQRHMEKYPQRSKDEIQAYALQVSALAGVNVQGDVNQLLNRTKLGEASLSMLGWLLPLADEAWQETMMKELGNRVEETAGTASFVSKTPQRGYLTLYSKTRDQAIVLDGLIAANPENDLIPKLVASLLGSRRNGHWNNTQENAFVILTLNRYFRQYEWDEPAFNAQVWLGDYLALEQGYFQRSTDRHHMEIPMNWLLEQGSEQDLLVRKEGNGRLYYRLGLSYAPQDLQQEASSHGFVVARRYEAIDDPEDVRQDRTGDWHIKAGARVRVVLDMVTQGQRNHVALVDPLPAGLEAISTESSEPVRILPNAMRHIMPQYRRWYQFHDLRDDRAEAVTTRLGAGTYQFRYIARATTPGSFVAPPAKAEEVYAPETFGRSRTERVFISE